jgi:hypothetical protein
LWYKAPQKSTSGSWRFIGVAIFFTIRSFQKKGGRIIGFFRFSRWTREVDASDKLNKGYNTPNAGGMPLEGRGDISFNNLTVNNYTFLMNEIKAEMQARIVDALGLSGVGNAPQMADALIAQMGDNAEFDAFIDDVVKQGARLSAALNYNGYAVANYQQVSGAQPQSGVKLARISPDVDLTKGAFTPYRKENGGEIAQDNSPVFVKQDQIIPEV